MKSKTKLLANISPHDVMWMRSFRQQFFHRRMGRDASSRKVRRNAIAKNAKIWLTGEDAAQLEVNIDYYVYKINKQIKDKSKT